MAETMNMNTMSETFQELKHRASSIFNEAKNSQTLDSIRSYMAQGEEKMSNLVHNGLGNVNASDKLHELKNEFESFSKSMSEKISNMNPDNKNKAQKFMDDLKNYYDKQADHIKESMKEHTNQ